MAQDRSGQHQDALMTLEQLRQTMKMPQWATHTDAQRFLCEAEALIEGQTSARKP
jgi:hypothetical protein